MGEVLDSENNQSPSLQELQNQLEIYKHFFESTHNGAMATDVTKLAKKLSLLESKVELYEQELMSIRSTRHTLESIVGESDALQSLRREAQKAAATQFPVLITGESGTGKELFAQGIHHASARRLYPFVRINCSAIPKDLLESELFGYEKGAFTGAERSLPSCPPYRSGRFNPAPRRRRFFTP